MKSKKLCYCAAAGWFVVPANAALVSHYSLDDTSNGIAVDSINGNNAIWQNGTNTNLANAPGQVGGAADLSDVGGGNNYFEMMIPQLVGATGITISAWVNNDANNGYTGIFMTRDFNGQTNNSWGLAIENDSDPRFDSRVDGPGIDSPNGAAAVNGEWKHVALVWDGSGNGSHTLYVNGVESATELNEGNLLTGTIAGPDSGPWYIGFDNCCGGGRDYDGRLDEISVWDNALTAEEVNAVYQSGLVPEPGVSLLSILGVSFFLRRRR